MRRQIILIRVVLIVCRLRTAQVCQANNAVSEGFDLANAQKGYTYDAGSYHSGRSAEIWGTEIGAGVDGGGRCVDCMQSTL